MLFLIGIVAGLIVGLISGGKLSHLALLRFRWPWLIVAAILIRLAALTPPLARFDASRYVYALALAAIEVWTLWHINRLPGIWVVSAGAALNLLVIVVNGFRMPVAAEFAGSLVQRGHIGQYTVMGSNTDLNPLADWIRLWPSPEVYSPGDVLVSIGVAIVVFLAVRNPRPYKELSPP